MKRKDYSDFDVVSFLEDNDIYHRFSGENVGRGWVGFRCPFCEGDKEHGGVNLTHKHFSCFQCAESASPPKLIKQIFNCSWAKAYEVLRNYLNRDTALSSWAKTPRDRGQPLRPVQLPALTGPLSGPGGHYLSSRGFNPEAIEAKYGVKESGPLGKYKFRLIIPVYFKKELVSFTSRDYTGKGEPKYKAQPVDEAMIPVSDCLYNIDTIKDDILIVEGPADVWRMGDGAVALFGLSCSARQQEILFRWWMRTLRIERIRRKMRKKRAVILLDPKTRKAADKLYYALTSFIRDIKIVELFGKDPAELTQQEAMNLKKELFS
jgi:DNA primase